MCCTLLSRYLKMSLDAELYSSRKVPVRSAHTFLTKVLPQHGWGRTDVDEVVLDVGCGPGGTTTELILPLFSSSSRIFAVDINPDMIALARKINSTSQIEYSVADFEDWSALERWKNQITKLVSILCFQWLKDQRNAFKNVFQLLQKEGEAALYFVLKSTFHATVLEMRNSPKWSHFFERIENYVPESHYKGYDDFHYRKIAEEMGFEVLYCKSEEKIDVFSSDKEYREFFISICDLRNYVPREQLQEFENDFIQSFLRKNGRDANGRPLLKATFIEMVIKRK